MSPKPEKPQTSLERSAAKFTDWVGSTSSLIVHTLLFVVSFGLIFFGAPVDEIQEDVDKLEEDEQEDDLHDTATMKTLDTIQTDLQKLLQDIQNLKDQKK